MKNLSLKKITIATLISLAISIILLGLLTVFVFYVNLNERTVSALVQAVSILSVFLSAFILAKNISGGGLINGLMLGIIYCAILLLLSFAVGDGPAFDLKNITRIFIITASAMLGGVLGINT